MAILGNFKDNYDTATTTVDKLMSLSQMQLNLFTLLLQNDFVWPSHLIIH